MQHVRTVAASPRGVAAHELAVASPANDTWKGLLPCLFYLFIEFARPMAWVPALEVVRPGLLAGIWGLSAALLLKYRPFPRILVYMLGFQLLMLWHVYAALNNFLAFEGARDYAIILFGCMLPIAVLPRNVESIRILLTGYVVFHVPTAINGIIKGGTGLGSWMGDENDLALALNAALGVGFYLFVETRSVMRRVILAVSMAVMVSAIVATLSRGGFVGLAALGAYMLFFGPKRQWVVIALIVGLVGLAFFAPASWWTEMGTITSADEDGDTGAQRYYFWGIAWNIFLEHPVAGAGTINYGIHALNHHDRPEMIYGSMWRRAAHSMYFTLLAEQGLIGVVLFLLVVAGGWRALRRVQRWGLEDPEDPRRATAAMLASGVAAGAVTVLVTGLFLSSLYYPVLWILAAVTGSLYALTVGAERGPEPASERVQPARRRTVDEVSRS